MNSEAKTEDIDCSHLQASHKRCKMKYHFAILACEQKIFYILLFAAKVNLIEE